MFLNLRQKLVGACQVVTAAEAAGLIVHLPLLSKGLRLSVISVSCVARVVLLKSWIRRVKDNKRQTSQSLPVEV